MMDDPMQVDDKGDDVDDVTQRPLWWNSLLNDTLDSVYMTQQTDLAKTLVRTAARAFYDDSTVIVVDFLLRIQFLRDGPGMAQELVGIKPKFLKAVLAFLQEEHWVAMEWVEGIVVTRDATRTYRRRERGHFYFIDLNRAVHTIRLRLHRLMKQLEQQQLEAATQSHYVCPSYLTEAKICSGYYDEMEVQTFRQDEATGLFLCVECEQFHRHNPNPPPLSSYTLQLVDKKEIEEQATEQLRRLQVQMTAHSVTAEDGTTVMQFRKGIYDLLQQLQTVSYKHLQGLPITSNLPSENGAEEHLRRAHHGGDTTEDYQQQVTQELSTLVYCRNSRDGSRMVMEIEHRAGWYASHWAERGVVRRRQSGRNSSIATLINAASAVELTDFTSGTTAATKTDDTHANNKSKQARKPSLLDIPRPAKMTCRNTTPYFLKDNVGRGSGDNSAGMDQVMEGTRRLSMDQSHPQEAATGSFIPFHSRCWALGGGQETTAVVLGQESKASQLEQFLGSVFHHQQQLQMMQQDQRQHRPMKRSSSTPSMASMASTYRSTDSKGAFANVDWQSCDSAAMATEQQGKLPQQEDLPEKSRPQEPPLQPQPQPQETPGKSPPQEPPPQSQPQEPSLQPQPEPKKPKLMRRSSSNPSLPSLWNSVDLQGFDLNNAFASFEFELVQDPILSVQQQQQKLPGQTSSTGGAVTSSQQQQPQNDNRQEQPQPQPQQTSAARKPSLMRRSSSFPSIAGSLHSVDLDNFFFENFFPADGGLPPRHSPTDTMGCALTVLKKPTSMSRGSSSASGSFLANLMASRDSLIPDDFSFQSRDIGLLPDDDQKPAAKRYGNDGLPFTENQPSNWPRIYEEALKKQAQTSPPSVAAAASAQKVPPAPSTAKRTTPPQKKKSRVKEPAAKIYVEPNDNDILSGRGTKSNLWPGNKEYRAALELAKPDYNAIPNEKKSQKTTFTANFVEQMTAQGRRFLKKDTTNGQWYEITNQEARKKVGQALREENTPEVRENKRKKYPKKSAPIDTPK